MSCQHPVKVLYKMAQVIYSMTPSPLYELSAQTPEKHNLIALQLEPTQQTRQTADCREPPTQAAESQNRCCVHRLRDNLTGWRLSGSSYHRAPGQGCARQRKPQDLGSSSRDSGVVRILAKLPPSQRKWVREREKGGGSLSLSATTQSPESCRKPRP